MILLFVFYRFEKNVFRVRDRFPDAPVLERNVKFRDFQQFKVTLASARVAKTQIIRERLVFVLREAFF